jgi:ParB family chromosome partitioning protein
MANNKTTKTDIYNIDPRNIIVVDGFNSRIDFGNLDELAAQIKEQGMLNPISVIAVKDDNGEEKYRLVDGERRYRAVMKLIAEGNDIARIKAIFLSKSISEEEMLAQQMLRNEGKPFTEYELGILCAKLRDKCGKTVAEIAKMLGKNPGVISYALKDLEYDPRIQEMLKKGEICGPDVRRVFTAAKEKYGEDKYEAKATAELLKIKEKSVKDGNDDVSIKDCLLVSDSKDTKAFAKGMTVFNRYIFAYERRAGGKIDINPVDLAKEIAKDPSKTIREIFDAYIKNKKAV